MDLECVITQNLEDSMKLRCDIGMNQTRLHTLFSVASIRWVMEFKVHSIKMYELKGEPCNPYLNAK
jgi:hypothetical protein